MIPDRFTCFQASRGDDGKVGRNLVEITRDDLPRGDVLIDVHWSSLNYKDALAASGHPGVAGPLPHVPGIDAAGVVADSADARFQVGDEVLVTGYQLGAPVWGGWSEFIRVPAEWIVPRPAGLTLRQTMVLGTAGFTAAQCVRELQRNEVDPAAGAVVVTGATGGVGSWAVRLLAQLGYQVQAITGKPRMASRLQELGAAEVLGRDALRDDPARPLLSARWAGAVDTVGGEPLAALLKSLQVEGCVAACGLVAGHELPTTVYPFILRGVTLAGVTSSLCPRPAREEIWRRLAGDWKIDLPDDWVAETTLASLPAAVEQMLAGQASGRIVVRLRD